MVELAALASATTVTLFSTFDAYNSVRNCCPILQAHNRKETGRTHGWSSLVSISELKSVR